MTRVSVRFFAGAAEAFGATETQVEGADTVAGLIESLAGADERLRMVLDQCSFFVDGEHSTALEKPLPEDGRIDVLPPFAGG